MRTVAALTLVAFAMIAACGDDDGPIAVDSGADSGGSGGADDDAGAGTGALGGGGGSAATGGDGGSGGASATGGDGGSGGVSATGGDGGSGGASATGGDGGSGAVSGAGGVGGSCGSADVLVTRVIPTVQLVIDGSGSMDQTFGTGTRWSALHDALLGVDGVVTRLESTVRFGMSIYQSGMSVDACPVLTGPAPALNNYLAIESAWLPSPAGTTPTAEAMRSVITGLGAGSPDAPTSIVLATDGAPNGCAGADTSMVVTCLLNPNTPECIAFNMQMNMSGYPEVLQAAVDARAIGVSVHVIDLSDGGANRDELQKVANVGAGLAEDATPPATLFAPSDPSALTDALNQIIGGTRSCTLSIQGRIADPDAVCTAGGIVTLNGQPLACDDPHGWEAPDATHIKLLGNACMALLGNVASQVSATFPCNVVISD